MSVFYSPEWQLAAFHEMCARGSREIFAFLARVLGENFREGKTRTDPSQTRASFTAPKPTAALCIVCLPAMDQRVVESSELERTITLVVE